MKLVPFNRRDLTRRTSAFDSFYDVLDDFFSDAPNISRNLNHDTFKIDIEEKDNEYVVEAEIPGVYKEEVDIQLDDGRLTISINREESEDIEEKNYIHKERRYTSMSRGVYLDNIVNDDIKATLEDGVLSINIPKKDKVDEVKKITIE